MSPAKVALLTGATGFIGSRLAVRLLEDGYSLHLVIRADSNLNQISSLTTRADLHLHTHDGTTRALIDIVEAARPKTVFHLASLFIAEHVSNDVEPLISSNILFGTQILEAMRINDVRHLVNTGTSWQHFHSTNTRPSCLYAATKQAFEDIVDFYCDAYALRAVTLKLFDTYGPGDPRRKLFKVLNDAARSAEPLSMSAGEQQIDLVYIDDAVGAFRVAAARLAETEPVETSPAAQSTPAHEIFGVYSGNPLPLRRVVELYKKVSAPNLRINWGARPYRRREVMVNCAALPRLPGWSAKVNLQEGLQRMHQAGLLTTLAK